MFAPLHARRCFEFILRVRKSKREEMLRVIADSRCVHVCDGQLLLSTVVSESDWYDPQLVDPELREEFEARTVPPLPYVLVRFTRPLLTYP